MQEDGEWGAAGDLLAREAAALEVGGADLLLICANTMHKVADRVEGAVGIPLLHLVDATAGAVRAAGVTTVGLLGTRFTMEQTFYRDRLAEHGLVVRTPPADDRDELHRIIYDELCQGLVEDGSRTFCERLVADFAEQGCEGVILGCTELELILDPDGASPVPLFATTRIHVQAAVDAALAVQRSEQ